MPNESHTFSANASGQADATSINIDILGFTGTTQVRTQIGELSGLPTGMTMKINNNGTINTSITVSVTSSLITSQGTVKIPITVDGITVEKSFSYALSRTGETGAQGIQGLQGEKGEQGIPGTDGKTSYFHIKYSSVSNPTSSSQMTETPSTYIGTYVDYTAADSSDPSKYTWSRFQGIQGETGEQGIPGTNGSNGKTSYLHIKYSNDGGKTFTANNGENAGDYIGQYVDFVQADSTSVSDYTWSKVKGDKGDTGATGVGISGVTEYYQVSSSNSTAPTSWVTTVPTMTATNKYLWNYEKITYTDGSTKETSKRVIGVYGDKGNTGATGATGKGIKSVTNYYLATTSSSGVTTSTSGWTTTVQSVTSSKKYLWNYEVVTYTDNTTTTTTPCIIGSYGDKGDKGDTGAAGKGIKSITNYYLATTASSGVTTSTSGWTTSIQSITSSKRYLWNYEVVTYTDNTTSTTTPVIIGVWGNTGSTGETGKGIKSITEYYLASSASSGVSTSTSGWSTSMQTTTTTNKYLWNYEKITYTDDTTSNSTVRIIGTHGDTGAAGRVYELSVSTLVIKKGADNALSPSTVTFSGHYRDGSSATRSAYSGRFKIEESTDGNTFTTKYTSSANEASKAYTPSSSNVKVIRCTLYASGGTTNALDVQSVVVLTDIANLEIGGRNLARKTSNEYCAAFNSFNGNDNICSSLAHVYLKGLSVGDKVTVRLVYKYTNIVAVTGKAAIAWIQGAGNITEWNSGTFTGSPNIVLSGSGEKIIKYSFVITSDMIKNQYWNVNIRHNGVQSGSVQWKEFKVEKGNIATDWTPAPEDIQDQFTTVTNSIKGVANDVDQVNKKIIAKVWQNDITDSINNYDGSTVKSIRNRVTSTETDISGIKTTLSDVQTTVSKKADGSTVQTLSTKFATMESNFNGFKTTVSNTYTTKDELWQSVSNITSQYTQLADKFNWIVKSGTSASDFTITDRMISLTSTALNIDALTTFKNSAEKGSSTVINGGAIKANTITADKLVIGDFMNYADLTTDTASKYGFTVVQDSSESNNPWLQLKTLKRDTEICPNGYKNYKCNGGETFRIKFQVSSTVQGTYGIDSSDTKKYLYVNVGLYGKTKTGSSSWIVPTGGLSDADGTVRTVNVYVTLPSDLRTFSVYLQLNGYNFTGTCKVRNISVTKMMSGELIVNGAITTDKLSANVITTSKLATDAIKSTNYSYSSGNFSSAGTFLDLSTGLVRSKNFAIDSSGNVYLKGNIQANAGYIGGTSGWAITTNTITGNANSKIISGILESSNYVENSSGVQMNLNTGIIKGNIEATTLAAKDALQIYVGNTKRNVMTGYVGSGFFYTILGCDLTIGYVSRVNPSIILNKSSSSDMITINTEALDIYANTTISGSLVANDLLTYGVINTSGNNVYCNDVQTRTGWTADRLSHGQTAYSNLMSGRISFKWAKNSSGVWKIYVYVDGTLVRSDW